MEVDGLTDVPSDQLVVGLAPRRDFGDSTPERRNGR